MKYIKFFENIKNDTINYIKKFFNKYNLNYLIINKTILIEGTWYEVHSFIKMSDNIYLRYNHHIFDKNKQIKNIKINNIYPKLLIDIWNNIKNDKLNPKYLLEMSRGDINQYISILQNTKSHIDFNYNLISYHFKFFKYQNILFKTHPETTTAFIEAGEKIIPYFFKKYPKVKKLYDEYFFEKDIKNLYVYINFNSSKVYIIIILIAQMFIFI